jgi:hypothetical protein
MVFLSHAERDLFSTKKSISIPFRVAVRSGSPPHFVCWTDLCATHREPSFPPSLSPLLSLVFGSLLIQYMHILGNPSQTIGKTYWQVVVPRPLDHVYYRAGSCKRRLVETVVVVVCFVPPLPPATRRVIHDLGAHFESCCN